MNQLATLSATQTPTLVTAAGDRAAYRFLEFFTAQIRNPHTRRAYVRAIGAFCAWLEAHGVSSIVAVGSIHVAAYVEDLATGSPPQPSSSTSRPFDASPDQQASWEHDKRRGRPETQRFLHSRLHFRLRRDACDSGQAYVQG